MPTKYRKDPISQVVCEFRFEPSADWDATVLGLVYSELREDFPTKRPFKASVPLPFALNFEAGSTDLVQFVKKDESALIQVGPNYVAVILNAAVPGSYPGWEEYLPLCHQGLDAYLRVAEPQSIQRIGLRYVNRVSLPEPVTLEDWFKYYLHVPSDSPMPVQDMFAFAGVSQYFLAEGRDILTAQVGSGGRDELGSSVCLLDLDYGLVQPRSVPFDGVGDWLEDAHTVIQNFFEAAITPELRGRFEPYE